MTEKYTGANSQTLSITELPAGQTFSYKVQIATGDGYKCYSEPFTVTRHQHSWTYTASGATITATCEADGCPLTDKIGGTLTLVPPTDLIYDGYPKQPTPQTDTAWVANIGELQGSITYYRDNEPAANHADAGDYRVEYRVNGDNNAVAEVTYTIKKAPPTATDFTFKAPAPDSLTYNGTPKTATVTPSEDKSGMGAVTVKYYQDDTLVEKPTNAGNYTVKINVTEGNNYAAATQLTAEGWKFTITKADPTPPTGLTGVTGKKLSTVTLPQGWSWKNGDAELGAKGSYTFDASYAGDDNHKSITTNLTVTVSDKYTNNTTMKVTQAGCTFGNTLPAYSLTGKPTNAGTETAHYTGTLTKDNSSYNAATAPTEAGTYQVTVKCETNDTIYEATSAEFTIEPKSIAGANITLQLAGEGFPTKKTVYTGTEQIVGVGSVNLSGKEEALQVTQDYTVETGDNTTKATNVGSYTVTVKGTGNYNDTANVSWEITPAELTIKSATAKERPYEKDKTDVEITSVTFEGVVPSGTPFQMNADYTATGVMNDDNAGDSKDVNVTVELKNTNYTLNETTTTTTVKITKANWNKAKANGSAKFGTSGTVDLTDLIAPGGTAAVEGELPADSVLDGTPTVVDGKLNFTFKSDATVGSTAIVKVNVTKATNYNDYEIAVTLTVLDKYPPVYTAPKAIENLVYNGKEQDLIVPGKVTNGGKMLYKVGTDDGKWTETVPKGKEATNYTVFYKIEGTDDVAAIEATQVGVVTIAQKKATIQPKSVTITKGDAFPTFELEYIGLVNGEKLTPSEKPTFRCLKELSSATQVTDSSVPGKYPIEWMNSNKITFNDGTNYELSKENIGYLTIQAQSSGGGSTGGGSSSSGGGSSRPSTSTGKTDTTTKPDGTKVQTETKADGTKIQTVTGKDGSTVKTTTNPNGSSVTETKAADGSTATVKTDKHGQTTAETALSSKAVENAKRSGEPVTAPVEVKATRDSNTAPTVKVELPKNSGETKVEIPVSNVTPGTVAVLVHPDGTEEIVKNTLPTADGIQLTVNGGATVKIVDNSKDFVDTRNHWAKDAIDFISARGLVNGTGESTFSPNAPTTRAQLWTILARQAGADLTGGASWYEKAQAWAKERGISDGSNHNGAIIRAQMVTMLYRAAGSPEVSITTTFTDVPADSYYAKAVAWAVENGITTGIGSGKFDPNGTCTRAQIATFLWRAMAE